ncbi:MAG: antibiotic biosynthesis monooxygenase [Caulobacteraceae bacterium]|nr:antibiotic biosynthesis monooxygenase [Caulobacteraceae bacterium]
MSLVIAGTIRVPPEHLEAFRPHMLAMLEASRAEDGCLVYSYAEDVAEPGLIRVFEAWRDQAALEAHFATAHLAAWRAAWPEFGVSDRRLIAYEVASQRAV